MSCLVERLRREAMMWPKDSELGDLHKVFTATIDLIEKLEVELRSQEAELRAARWQLKTKQNIIDRLIDEGRNPNS